jgi:uncharacterized membrane protein YozB (DUF420 family)
MKGGNSMLKVKELKKRLPRFFRSVIATVIMFLFSVQMAYAQGTGNNSGGGTIWTQFSNVMRDIYTQLLGISTILAVTAAAVALIVRMVSRNQRAVDEATSWLKRIVVTWIILNTMGFFIAYIQPWLAGGQYTP